MDASIPTSSPGPARDPAQLRAERRALAELERERKEEADARTTVWSFIWTVFAFKIATVLIILYVASGSNESIGMALATTWYWFIIPIVAIAGPLLYRWRLVVQRRQRNKLRDAEWMVDVDGDGDETAKRSITGGSTGTFSPDSIQIIIHRPDDPPLAR